MKGEDIFGLVIIVTILIAGAVFVSYVVGHSKGFNQGARTVELYQEATGGSPSQDWLDDHQDNHFIFPEDILRSLNPYDVE